MRIVSPEEAVAGIRSRDQIYLQCAAATPSVLLDALVARELAGHKHAAAVRDLILKYGQPAERLGAGPAFELRRVT